MIALDYSKNTIPIPRRKSLSSTNVVDQKSTFDNRAPTNSPVKLWKSPRLESNKNINEIYKKFERRRGSQFLSKNVSNMRELEILKLCISKQARAKFRIKLAPLIESPKRAPIIPLAKHKVFQ